MFTKEELIVEKTISLYRRMLGVPSEPECLYDAGQLALAIHCDTASVPEQEFAESLIELLLQNKVKITRGWMSEDEYAELTAEEPDFKESIGLEIFINPRDLFNGGNIRPDVAIRKDGKDYIIFEVDSFQYHSNQEQLTKDKIRERKIQKLGYPVYRFSAKECLDGRSWSAAMEAFDVLKRHKFLI